jgi:GNAT superfamily N-acetyltransferase
VTASLRPLGRRAQDTWAATGHRFPIVAATWLVRREYLITVRPVDGSESVPRLPGVRWGPIEDPAQLRAGDGDPWPARPEVRRRLAEGQECWAAWIAGELAHWRWEAVRPIFLPYLGISLRPQAGDLCVVDVYTAPRYRGQGLHTAGTFLALQRARARRLTRLVGLVAWWNAPARHVMEGKTARTVVGSVGYWTVGPGRRYFVRGGVQLEREGIVIPAACPVGSPTLNAALPS